MSRKEDIAAARKLALTDLAHEVLRRNDIVAMHDRGSIGDTYRREIARLWRVAFRAAKAAAK